MKANRKLRKHHDRSDDRDQTLPVHIRPVSAVALEKIKPHPRNPRTHSKKQIGQIADSMRAFGFAAPVLIDEQNGLLAGHGRVDAAKLIGLKTIPAIVITGLSEARGALMHSPMYRRIFPRTRISSAKDTEAEIRTTAGGSRLTTSVGGTLTGRGGNLLVIDDPLKPQDAQSESARESLKQWNGRQ